MFDLVLMLMVWPNYTGR